MASTERNNDGLEADLGITLNKLTMQLAKAEARMIKTAKKFETDFANANRKVQRGYDSTAKSAQNSANTIGKEMDRLRAKYDPIFAASKRYEAELEELNRAHKVGAINVGQYEAALERLNAEYAISNTRVAQSTSAFAGLSTVTKGTGGGIQNVAFQIGDFATQVGAGTSASIALGQQLPQLLGGFGALGAVMGAVVAVGVPLARVLLESGDASEDLEEKLENLEQAVNAYSSAVSRALVPTDELREKYGTATAAAQEFITALEQINRVEALEAVQSALSAITSQFGGLTDAVGGREGFEVFTDLQLTIRRLSEEFGITIEQAERFALSMRAVSEAARSGSLEDQLSASKELLDVLIATLGPIESMDGLARDLAEKLSEAALQATALQGDVEKAEEASAGLGQALLAASGNLDVLVDQAGQLGDNMLRAASAAWDFVQARAQERDDRISAGPDGAVNDVRDRLTPGGLDRSSIVSSRRVQARPSRRSGGRSRSGGGAARQSADEAILQTGQRALQQLERQIEMLGKSRAEVVALTAKYRLLDEAKKRQIDVDEKSTKTGKTLRDTIEEQSAAIEQLYQQYEKAQSQAQFFSDAQQDLKNGLLDSIIEGENFADVLANIAKRLARASLEAALFNEGIFSQGGSGGGLLGGLFKTIFGRGQSLPSADGGGYTGRGARTGGIDGKGGFPAILHPNETVVDHTKGQALGGYHFNMPITLNAAGASAGDLQMVRADIERLRNEIPAKVIQTVRRAPKMNVAL